MGWRSWLGLAPRRDEFGRDLIRQAARRGAPGWSYDAGEAVLSHPEQGRQFFVNNSWLEYSRAPRATRAILMEKYMRMMLDDAPDVPKLWDLAAKNLYACLRSRYQLLTTEIESRGETPPFVRPISRPWRADLEIVLMYDFGPYLAQVKPENAEVWGQSHEALFARAQANLTALRRPRWESIADGVFRIVSDVSYEESFVLVDTVIAALDVQGDPVVVLPNRGVLLATGSDDAAGLQRLIAEATRSMQEQPWTMSAALLRRVAGQWEVFEPGPPLASTVRAFELLSLAGTYSEQQDALQKHLEKQGVDVYVAKFSVMNAPGSDAVRSWCVWSEDVPSLLPLTDVVILRRNDESEKPVIVPWAAVERLCGAYMRRTEDEPPRFDVNVFPSAEWAQLVSAGEQL